MKPEDYLPIVLAGSLAIEHVKPADADHHLLSADHVLEERIEDLMRRAIEEPEVAANSGIASMVSSFPDEIIEVKFDPLSGVRRPESDQRSRIAFGH